MVAVVMIGGCHGSGVGDDGAVGSVGVWWGAGNVVEQPLGLRYMALQRRRWERKVYSVYRYIHYKCRVNTWQCIEPTKSTYMHVNTQRLHIVDPLCFQWCISKLFENTVPLYGRVYTVPKDTVTYIYKCRKLYVVVLACDIFEDRG